MFSQPSWYRGGAGAPACRCLYSRKFTALSVKTASTSSGSEVVGSSIEYSSNVLIAVFFVPDVTNVFSTEEIGKGRVPDH